MFLLLFTNGNCPFRVVVADWRTARSTCPSSWHGHLIWHPLRRCFSFTTSGWTFERTLTSFFTCFFRLSVSRGFTGTTVWNSTLRAVCGLYSMTHSHRQCLPKVVIRQTMPMTMQWTFLLGCFELPPRNHGSAQRARQTFIKYEISWKTSTFCVKFLHHMPHNQMPSPPPARQCSAAGKHH